jgi:hypothetical protein
MLLEIEGAGTYRLITSSTIERDIALANLLRACGLEDVIYNAIAAGREPDAEIFAAVSGSGKLFDILGACLIPEGVDQFTWTPKIGNDIAEKLRHVTHEKAKQIILQSVVELVKSFFLKGLYSYATSRNSSPGKTTEQQPLDSAAISTSGNGRRWFERLRDTILRVLWKSSGGR